MTQVNETTETKDVEQEEQKEETIVDVYKKVASRPSDQQVEQWKAKYGDVFVSGFSNDEVYVWRAISRKEWIVLQTELEEAQKNNVQLNPMKIEESMVAKCLLWRSLEVSWDDSKAGTLSTLHEQIMQNSNFYTPQGAAMLVGKL